MSMSMSAKEKLQFLRFFVVSGSYDTCEDCHMTAADESEFSVNEKRQLLPNLKKYEGVVFGKLKKTVKI